MQYKIIFKATREDHENLRHEFKEYINAIREGVYLVDGYLGIYPNYLDDKIEFELDLPDCFIEQQQHQHLRFMNSLLTKFWQAKHLFESRLLHSN